MGEEKEYDQIVINDIEIHGSNLIYGIEFDDEGEVAIFLVPIRPGKFEYYVKGYKEREKYSDYPEWKKGVENTKNEPINSNWEPMSKKKGKRSRSSSQEEIMYGLWEEIFIH